MIDIPGLVKQAIVNVYKSQFRKIDKKSLANMVDTAYLRICETGRPDNDEVGSLAKILKLKVREDWMKDPDVLTFNAVMYFQRVQVIYWASQIGDVKDISLANVPIFYRGHIPPQETIEHFKIQPEEMIEVLEKGWKEKEAYSSKTIQ